MDDENMNRKNASIMLIVFSVIFSIIGGTLSYWTWQTNESEKTNVTFKVTSTFSCAADGGGNITSADVSLAPATCTNSTYAIKRTVTVKPTTSNMDMLMNLWLNVDKLDSGLSNSQNFKYALTTSDTSCETGVVSTGTFNGKTAGDKVYILSKKYSATTTETYYLYIWLDKAETNSSTMDQKFSLSLGGDCTNTILSEPEAPVLDDDGMIPVTISDTGVTKTISSTDSNWYDYKNKKWANVILTTSSSRSKYLGTSGVEVTQSDILAYYVWIPRYKYKIWTIGVSSSGKEQPIDIAFEGKNDAMSLETTVGGYRTHPAFWWDSDNDGVVDSNETLAGIWVGKFETTGDATTPTVLPDMQSLRNQKVSVQFTTSLKFSGGTLTNGVVTFAGSDTYGLSNTMNSHMMKNNEWGAVAYLSHSIYGANREIYVNNSSQYYTGRSGGNVGGSTAINDVYTDQSSTTQYNNYGFYTWDGYLLNYGTNDKSETHDIKKVSSTTGNITGIYDISGGSQEYVMGVLADSNGNPRSGNSASYNSGFNGLLNDETSYTEGISFPSKQYYDLYTSTIPTTACSGGICYGHALSETSGWYSDTNYLVSSYWPWFSRGGFTSGVSSGVFHSYNEQGRERVDFSWRSVLVAM